MVISDKRCKTQPGACYILFYSAKRIGNYFIHVEGIVGCRCKLGRFSKKDQSSSSVLPLRVTMLSGRIPVGILLEFLRIVFDMVLIAYVPRHTLTYVDQQKAGTGDCVNKAVILIHSPLPKKCITTVKTAGTKVFLSAFAVFSLPIGLICALLQCNWCWRGAPKQADPRDNKKVYQN